MDGTLSLRAASREDGSPRGRQCFGCGGGFDGLGSCDSSRAGAGRACGRGMALDRREHPRSVLQGALSVRSCGRAS
jgi:hypothetical protein